MYFIKSIIDILIIILLLRLLIRANEAYFNPIYGLIHRITEALIMPARYITRDPSKGVLIIILCFVLLRGAIYVAVLPVPATVGVGISFLNLLQLLFQAYMVMLIISVLSGQRFGSTFHVLMNRAFTPFQKALGRFGLHGQHFYLSVFVSLLILYALISVLITGTLIPKTPVASASLIRGFGEGLMLILALFPFPGFFSLIIIVGALLSWVSPDPSNPVVQTIYGISEPLLMPFRRFIPLVGGLDLSPIAALFCFQILGGIGLDLVGNLMK